MFEKVKFFYILLIKIHLGSLFFKKINFYSLIFKFESILTLLVFYINILYHGHNPPMS